VLFRSLRSLAARALAAGAASAVALTLFNAAQPTLGGSGRVQPGTLQTVKVTLAPVPAPPRVRQGVWGRGGCGSSGGCGSGGGCGRPGAPGRRAGYAPPPGGRIRGRGAEGRPGHRARGHTGGGAAAAVDAGGGGQGPVRGALLARPGPRDRIGDDVAAGPHRSRMDGLARGRAGADGPDATSREYRRAAPTATASGWTPAPARSRSGSTRRPGPPRPRAGPAGTAAADPSAAMTGGLEAHLITPDLTPTPGAGPARPGVATAATIQPRIVSRAAWGADERIRRPRPTTATPSRPPSSTTPCRATATRPRRAPP
jgi:hypothetical protein